MFGLSKEEKIDDAFYNNKLRLKVSAVILVAVVITMFSSCTVVSVGDELNPVDVSYALERIEDYYGKEVYIKAYPVAYSATTTFIGSKLYEIYFSDSASDYLGKLDFNDELHDDWLLASVREDDPLWVNVEKVFNGSIEPELMVLAFEVYEDSVLGYYYHFEYYPGK